MLTIGPEREIEEIAARLASSGALALVRMEFSLLRRIERRYGGQAHERMLSGLSALAQELAQAIVASDDVLVAREPQADALLVFLFRPRSDWAFYTSNLRKVGAEMSTGMARQGRRAVYPYHRDALSPSVGTAVVLHDPHVTPLRQINQAVEDARRDAVLEAGLRSRRTEQRLLHLILCSDIRVRYEKIVELASGDTYGHEALARGPEGSDLHTPRQLFGKAEELGLLGELDGLCRRVALENARVLPPGGKLFLNCLPAGIGDPALRAEGLRKTLENHGLHPSDLVLEISENESIDNFAIFREMRDACQDLGIQIAVDDAGTGYASLEAIMEIAPDFIKLDMSLVRGIDTDPARQAVVRAVNAVALGIGALVVAEGIETEPELAAIRDLEIPYGQGFHFGPAVTSSDSRGSSAGTPPRRTT